MTQQRLSHIAIVVPALSSIGGVSTVAEFLVKVLAGTSQFKAHLISLPLSSRDTASVRLRAPRSWLRGPQINDQVWQGQPFQHVGCYWAEFESQRYRPHRALTDLLNQFDLIQVVGGTPAWAYAARQAIPPVCLFTATVIRQDRGTRLRQTTGWRRYWLEAMTQANERAERAALASSQAIFAESDYTARLIEPYTRPDRVYTAPPGVDADFFVPALTYAATGYLLCVGRLDDVRKNMRLLFAAYQQLLHRLPDAPQLVLAGRHGPTSADMAYARALGILEHIDIKTDLSAEQLRALYQGAAAFVLPSDEEGLGIVLLEAMACGLPVISTDCGGPATIVHPPANGLLTPVGDADALAGALYHLLADPATRSRMGQAGRAQVEAQYSLSAAGQVYLDVYHQLLSR